ncbi:hypothetical protein TcWFU_001834 [Taenia crassiceps]|uniref:Uncharacterized protein n=1 Tax=Taenia crassiceps TaxID=6207 RepID=A0ABR4QG55_9CEST
MIRPVEYTTTPMRRNSRLFSLSLSGGDLDLFERKSGLGRSFASEPLARPSPGRVVRCALPNPLAASRDGQSKEL